MGVDSGNYGYSPSMPAIDGQRLIEALGLEPHPEGGHFRRFHASLAEVECDGRRRPAMTAIHYLLSAGQYSRWHRVDADEAWHWQQGDPLELLQFDAATARLSCIRLGPADRDAQPCCIVPAGTWQAARPLGDFALVVCTVSPGFVWEGFEWLPDDGDVVDALRRLRVLPQ